MAPDVKGGPLPSPFTARRSETEVFANRRRSFFTTDAAATSAPQGGSAEPPVNPPEEGTGGAEDVTKRTRGLSGDILKEMKVRQEKRASVIPRTGGGDFNAERDRPPEDENPFGNVKLR